ncbi:hypothetical protein KAZ92_00620 [Candidatus Gracilibacteria bacterium]|jgi:hypothetical protein|nr:hypothetical protein [Candidatus Gracilibacteria bacterium]
MKKTKSLLDKLIEEIEKTPLIQIACDKVGISRNTFYRWMKEDRDFLSRVNEAMSLGTGLVSDVALSNVLEGIKRKDTMYTKYWLSHKHPDFRRPYVHRVDSDDLIAHFRSVLEGVKLRQIEDDIRNTSTEEERQKKEEAKRGADEFLDKWRTALNKPNEYRAQEIFEEWKKEYEKNGKKPPKIKKPKDSDFPSMHD